MGFSKHKFTSEILVKVPMPKAYGGGEIRLPLSIALNDDYEAVRLAFVGKPEQERTTADIANVVRGFVCSLLSSEPEGIDDFPSPTPDFGTSKLNERALDYFSNNEPDLQEFFDGIMLTAWLTHKELAEPETFPVSVSDGGARSDSVQAAAQ